MTDQPNSPFDPNQQPAADMPPHGATAGGVPSAPGYGSVPPPPAPPAPPTGSGDPAYGGPAPQGSNGLAIGALVCGVLSVPAACCTVWGGIILGIVAIVLAVLARKKAARGEAPRSGLAIGGLVLGIIGLLIGLAMAALALALGPKMEACNGKQSDPNAYQQCIMDQLGVQNPTPSVTR